MKLSPAKIFKLEATKMMIISLLLVASLYTPDLTCRVRDKEGHLVRSQSRRALFVKLTGGPRPGLVVNHIVPLRCGGCDLPSNMEWMTVEGWKARTGPERYDCGRHYNGVW